MITKERIKRKIDKLPNDQLEKVYKYISSISSVKKKKKKFHTYKLKGVFDDIDIRKNAYE